MKKVKLKIIAVLIEYHWWRIGFLHKYYSHAQAKEHLHKYKAEQLAVLYEIYSGLRDCHGNIIA